jgi:urease accessory protein
MRSSVILPAGTWDSATAADRVELDFDGRHRRRILLRTEAGQDVLLDLARAAWCA